MLFYMEKTRVINSSTSFCLLVNEGLEVSKSEAKIAKALLPKNSSMIWAYSDIFYKLDSIKVR